MNRTRPKQIVIRASEDEFEKIKKKVSKSKLNQNEYLLKCCLNKKVNVVEGLKEMTLELKKIGNKLNEVKNETQNGKCDNSKELEEINKEMKEAWQLLRLLIQKTQ